ncbi:MAG: TolC family protein [Bacteroidales bacterium]|nr:TolC family protein [Bacteroidales bacterium]
MKKYIIAIFSLILAVGTIQAQQKWSLEQCIEYALKNNITIKSSELNTKSQEIKHQQAKNQRLPDLSGSGSGSLNFGQSLNSENTYENKNTSIYSVGLNSSLSLFSGFQIKNSIEVQKYNLQASLEDLKKAKENISVNIASAYLQVLLNKELYQVALEQIKLSQTQVSRYESMASIGKIPEGQVFEARAQLAKDKLSATESLSNLQLSLLDLSQLLDLKEWSDFDIVTPSINMQALTPMIQPADEVFNYAVTNKSTVKASEFRLKSNENSLKVSKGALYPKLSLWGSYSNRYYPDLQSIDPDNQTAYKVSFSKQFDINAGTAFGLSLSVPIFNRFDTRNNIKLSQFDVETAKLELDNTKKTLYKEIQQAWFNAQTASEKYKASTEAVLNTEEAYRFAEEKFNNGRSTIYEFNEAKMNLASARSNQLQAKYNYLFSIKILDFYKGEPLRL